MGNINPHILNNITNSPPIIEQKRFRINEPMAKIDFIRIQPLPDPDEQVPVQQEIEEKKISLKKIEEVKVKWRSFIKMREGNFLQEYDVIKQLGRGGFGSVYKVKGRYNGILRAAKKIKKSQLNEKEHERLFNEVSILQSLDHPNIIKLYEVYDMEDQYVLIMEICQGGELFKKIAKKRLDRKSVPKIMRQLLEVLTYIHSKGIVHRDIKPQNILLDKLTGDIKLIDFGIAVLKKTSNEVLSARIGTAFYIAPEVLCKEYGEKCDVWSAGVVLYMMLFNRPPFAGATETEIIQSILNNQPLFLGPIWTQLSKEGKDLLSRMLKKKPKQRLSSLQALNNLWLTCEEPTNMSQKLKSTEQNMQYFGFLMQFKNRLQAVVYTYCISQLVTNQEKAGLQEVFKKIDTDFDGIISLCELKEVLKQRVKDQQRLQAIMRLIDLDGSGQIQYTEFLISALNPKTILKSQHYQRAFDYFDIDHSGGISYEQIAKFLEGQQSQAAIKDIFCEIDSNGDGNISRQEFVALFLKNASKSIKQIASNRKIKVDSGKKQKKLKKKQISFYEDIKKS